MVKHVEIAVTQALGEAPSWYQFIVRGVTNAGLPFVYTDGEADEQDMIDTLSAALVTNSVLWGVYDDITV